MRGECAPKGCRMACAKWTGVLRHASAAIQQPEIPKAGKCSGWRGASSCFSLGVLSGIKPVISPALTSCARRKALLNWWNEWVTGWCCRAALRGHWMLPLPLDYLGTHLSEILETSFLQALGVYTAYRLHSEQVLIPRWNRCSSSTNSRTMSKCLGKEAVTWRTSRFLDEARRHNPAFGEMTFQQKGVCGFLGWFGGFFSFPWYCKHTAEPQMHMEIKQISSCKPKAAHPRSAQCSRRWHLRGLSLPLHRV